MVALNTDPMLERDLIARRQATGADKFDEVWEGVYVMASLANDEHQDLVSDLTTVLMIAVDWAGLGKVRPGVNVSDHEVDWQHNYRCPDVVVFLNDTQAKNCGTHWRGGPDLVIEVVSEQDRSRDKLPFYASIAAREVMLIDRKPWSITLYRYQDGDLVEAGRAAGQPGELVSDVVPLSWRLEFDGDRPVIKVSHRDGRQHWSISPDAD